MIINFGWTTFWTSYNRAHFHSFFQLFFPAPIFGPLFILPTFSPLSPTSSTLLFHHTFSNSFWTAVSYPFRSSCLFGPLAGKFSCFGKFLVFTPFIPRLQLRLLSSLIYAYIHEPICNMQKAETIK